MKKKKQNKRRKNTMTIVEDTEVLGKIINKVQINEKKQTFRVRDKDFIPVIENILKDSLVSFNKKEKKNYCIFQISSGKTKFNEEKNIENIDDLKDLFF